MFAMYLADVAPPISIGPPARTVGYCASIDNLTDYPEYLIVAQIGTQSSGYKSSPYWVMTPETCLSLPSYYPVISFFAVPRSAVQPGDLVQLDPYTEKVTDREGNIPINPRVALKSSEIVESKRISSYDSFLAKPSHGSNGTTSHYTITSLIPMKNGLSVERVGQDPISFRVELLALPLLGLILLSLLRWRRRLKRKPSEKNSITPN